MKCVRCGKKTALDSRLLCAKCYSEVRIPDTIPVPTKGGK